MNEKNDLEPDLPVPIAQHEQKNVGWLKSISPQYVERIAGAIGKLVGTAARSSDTISKNIRENKSRDKISEAVSERVASGIINADPQYERAFQRQAEALLREQNNIDDVVEIAIENMGTPSDDKFAQGELDTDWLYQFENAAKGFSSDRMKHTFGRILSGEILKPGTFSPSTLQTIVGLGQRDARSFAKWASLSFRIGQLTDDTLFLITAGLQPGTNGFRPFGLDFSTLTQLQHCGLLHADFDTHINVPEEFFSSFTCFIGSLPVTFSATAEERPSRKLKVPGLFLTDVGIELFRVVDIGLPHKDYIAHLREYFPKNHQLNLVG